MVADKPTPFFRWMALCKTTGRRNYAYHLCHQHVFQINNGEMAISAHWFLPFLSFIYSLMAYEFFLFDRLSSSFSSIIIDLFISWSVLSGFWFDLVRLTKMIISDPSERIHLDGTYLLRWKIKLDEWVGTTFRSRFPLALIHDEPLRAKVIGGSTYHLTRKISNQKPEAPDGWRSWFPGIPPLRLVFS